MKFDLKLAMRFLIAGKTQTGLIFIGIAVGVAVLVFLTFLISGLGVDIIERTIGNSPHITISREDRPLDFALRDFQGRPVITEDASRTTREIIDEWQFIINGLTGDERISAVVAVADGPGFIIRGDLEEAIVIRGMNLDKADGIYNISSRLVKGNADLIAGTILIGTDLSEKIKAGIGDAVQIRLMGEDPESYLVGGIFDLGVQTLNQRWVIMNRERATYLLGFENGVNVIEAQVFEVFQSQYIAAEWKRILPFFKISSWEEANRQLLIGLRSQVSSSYTIQFFVLLAVTLAVSSVLAISAIQRARQIGILKAIGIRTKRIGRIFLLQGAVLGFTGSLFGSILGVALLYFFVSVSRTADGDPIVPVTVAVTGLAMIVLITTAAGTLAAYFPARHSAKLDPIEVIRNG